MTPKKQRMTVTVDPELVEAANRAVSEGEAESLSGWVSAALVEKVARDRKLAGLQKAVEAYEAEFGEITSEEMAAQARTDREGASIVRGRSRRAQSAASA
jgi:ribonuclease HII